ADPPARRSESLPRARRPTAARPHWNSRDLKPRDRSDSGSSRVHSGRSSWFSLLEWFAPRARLNAICGRRGTFQEAVKRELQTQAEASPVDIPVHNLCKGWAQYLVVRA